MQRNELKYLEELPTPRPDQVLFLPKKISAACAYALRASRPPVILAFKAEIPHEVTAEGNVVWFEEQRALSPEMLSSLTTAKAPT